MDDVKKNPFLRYLEYLTGRTQVRLYTVQFGVWSIAIRKEPPSFVPSFPNLKDAKRFIHHLGPAWMFVRDVYRIAPRQFLVYVLHRGWLSIDGGVDGDHARRTGHKICRIGRGFFGEDICGV